MAPTFPFPSADQSPRKKRKRTIDETEYQETSSGRSTRPRPPQKTGSISTLMNGMDIDSQPKDGDKEAEKRTLKRKKSHRRDESLTNVMEVDGAAEKDPSEQEVMHRRQKRLRKEPSVVGPPFVPPPKPKPVVEDMPVDGQKLEKKQKKKKKGKDVVANGMEESVSGPSNGAPALTPLQAAMKEKLQGSLFRQYNETIYKSDSRTFHEMVQKDPNVFKEYHAGFRRQVTSWPTNPVEHYISVFSSYPKRSMIVDLGCGDAALAKALVPKGFNVLSFDVVSDGEWVIEADVCDKIPLPGLESGGGRIIDVVVCALSLMSTNWPQCLRETRRILKDSGELKIAEVTSRFTNAKEFVSLVESLGFKLTKQDQPTTHFTLFDFQVSAPPNPPISSKDWKATLKKGPSMLKPCEYKRR